MKARPVPPTLLDIWGMIYDVNTNVVTRETATNQQQTSRNSPQ